MSHGALNEILYIFMISTIYFNYSNTYNITNPFRNKFLCSQRMTSGVRASQVVSKSLWNYFKVNQFSKTEGNDTAQFYLVEISIYGI